MSGYMAIRELGVLMKKLLKRCCPYLRLNQRIPKSSSLVMEYVITHLSCKPLASGQTSFFSLL
jgi:hypothetical protein